MDGNSLRLATPEDLLRIREWLEDEHNQGIEGSFFCNYNLIEAGQATRSLKVLVRDSDSLPIAFSLGDRNVDILAVKADCRGQGFGRYLAQHMIDDARKRDVIGMVGECAPSTSKGFWESLGFVSVAPPHGGDNPNWVACALPHDNKMPDGERHTIEIGLSDSQYTTQPVFHADAVARDGRYFLTRDCVQYVPDPNREIELRIDGSVVFSKKNKYIREIGGERVSPWVRVRHFNAG
jgi:GNAT superfamily N-acetyltransferase